MRLYWVHCGHEHSLLAALSGAEIDYVLVGGLAVSLRMT